MVIYMVAFTSNKICPAFLFPTEAALRNVAMFNCGYALLNRGDNRRALKLKNLGYSTLERADSYSRREVLKIMYEGTKTTTDNICTAAFRHQRWEMCFAVALASYLVFIFDIEVGTV